MAKSQREGGVGQSASAGKIRRYAPLMIMLALIGAAYAFGLHRYLTLQQLAEHRDMLRESVAANRFAAFGLFLLLYIVVVALSLPGGALLTIAGGFLFGWVAGGAGVVVAATLGAIIVFLIAKTSLGEPLASRAGPWLAKLRQGFQQDAMHYLLFLRLVPAFPFWLINLAPALLGVPLRTFAIGTLIGIIPGTFAFAFLGAGLDSVIVAQRAANAACIAEKGADACPFKLELSALVTPELLIALGALGIVALIPVILRRLKARAL